MQSSSAHGEISDPDNSELPEFRIGRRVHSAGDSRRIGTVKYVGPVQGYSGKWVGVDWDNGDGKHDGSLNGVRYFQAASHKSASFVRPHNLSTGITLLQALEIRYQTTSSKEEEDEMYVLSASNRRVPVELLGKNKILDKLSRPEELTSASVPYLGVSSAGPPCQISATVPNLQELDLTGNLLSEWEEVGAICEALPPLATLNLTNNFLVHDVVGLPQLKNVRILVLNNTCINWMQIETLKHSLPVIEELHLMGNKLEAITPSSSVTVQGFDSLRLLNLDGNCITDWNEILKLSQLRSLEQLYLNKNSLKSIWYPDSDKVHEQINHCESVDNCRPFQNLHCLLLGGNNIEDVASVDSLNYFPSLTDVRLYGNPITDPGKGGIPRFVLIACLAKVVMLNGSEVNPRERKDSEIRFVRLVMSKLHDHTQEILQLYPRFLELKKFHGIEDERPSIGGPGFQKMASGLISITLKCVGASFGEKPPMTKKLPATTTVGKLKILCETFFKLKSVKPKLFLQEEGSPLPTLLDDDMASLIELGVGNESTIHVDEES
ncbi:tubulin-folding cofactor E [Diospyros lotus]|uniref:tubulin-folding cofactor E n=1 Tax=Diospyros lotus TaxID=55363 RepID=UPI002253DAC0|nr:tubulin-folding cofactor E [Diospyros lotus]